MELQIKTSPRVSGRTVRRCVEVQYCDVQRVSLMVPYAAKIIIGLRDGSTLTFMIRNTVVLQHMSDYYHGLLWTIHDMEYVLKMPIDYWEIVEKVLNAFNNLMITEQPGSFEFKELN